MKRKISIILALSLMVCIFSGIGQAATTITLDAGVTDVTLGNPISIDVFLTTDAPGIFNGVLDFTYNTGLVDFTNFSVGPATDFNFLPNTSIAGQINDFGFGVFNPPLMGTDILLATITFNTTATGSALFDLFIDESTYGGWNDGNNNPITDFSGFTLNPATVNINAVPIPATMLLFGSSIFGLVGLRRMKRS